MAKKIQKGFIQEAFEIGEEIGIRVSMKRRELRSYVDSIVDILEAKFGRVPKRIENSLNKQIDVNLLRLLVIRSAMCSSLEEFAEDL